MGMISPTRQGRPFQSTGGGTGLADKTSSDNTSSTHAKTSIKGVRIKVHDPSGRSSPFKKMPSAFERENLMGGGNFADADADADADNVITGKRIGKGLGSFTGNYIGKFADKSSEILSSSKFDESEKPNAGKSLLSISPIRTSVLCGPASIGGIGGALCGPSIESSPSLSVPQSNTTSPNTIATLITKSRRAASSLFLILHTSSCPNSRECGVVGCEQMRVVLGHVLGGACEGGNCSYRVSFAFSRFWWVLSSRMEPKFSP